MILQYGAEEETPGQTWAKRTVTRMTSFEDDSGALSKRTCTCTYFGAGAG